MFFFFFLPKRVTPSSVPYMTTFRLHHLGKSTLNILQNLLMNLQSNLGLCRKSKQTKKHFLLLYTIQHGYAKDFHFPK